MLTRDRAHVWWFHRVSGMMTHNLARVWWCGRVSGMMSQLSGMMGQAMPAEDVLLGRLEQTRETIEK
jgi:hypothetical protein